MHVTNDPVFATYAAKSFHLNEEEPIDNVDDSGYFSDGSLASDAKEEVLDEFFVNHLEDLSVEEVDGTHEWLDAVLQNIGSHPC